MYWVSNLGLVIALAARARQFPSEYELIIRIQEAAIYKRSGDITMYAAAINWGADGYMWWTDHLATIFGLKYVGSQRVALPFGYIRLPSSQNDPRWRMHKERLYLARYAPDPKVIKGWSNG